VTSRYAKNPLADITNKVNNRADNYGLKLQKCLSSALSAEVTTQASECLSQADNNENLFLEMLAPPPRRNFVGKCVIIEGKILFNIDNRKL